MGPLKEEVVAVPQVPDPIRCPSCKGGNLVVMGALKREYDETWKDGNKVDERFGEGPLVHEVERFDCTDCQIRFIIQTRELYELTKANGELAEELSKFTGMNQSC